jgi:hypothetical protein
VRAFAAWSVLALLVAASGAVAGSKPYPTTPPSPFASPPPSVFYVRFEPGELFLEETDTFTVQINDVTFMLVGGLLCQDENEDGACGGVGEPRENFCGFLTQDVGDWYEDKPIYLFLDGFNGLVPSCDPPTVATAGWVSYA